MIALALATMPALAVQPDEVLKDAGLERRARALSAELRCLVCQNQSIDDSDAPLAKDLRVIVRERLVAGDSDGQIRDFLVARYGAFVMLRPPVTMQTILLWASPFMALAAGGLVVWRLRRRAAAAAATPVAGLTDEELARIDRLLDRDTAGGPGPGGQVTKP
jgi:cytochrome c-type biogenesis protein CcmH